MTATPPPTPTAPVRSPHPAQALHWAKTNPTFHAVIIVVLCLGLVVTAVAGALSRRSEAHRAAADHAALVRSTNATLAAQTAALLRLTALPLGWAFRGALLKDDLTAIDTYLRRIVQEPHVTGVVLVGPDGVITHASDQKLQGRPAQKVFPEVKLDAQSPASVATDQDVKIVVPVMGYDRRLGTLIFSYALPARPGTAS